MLYFADKLDILIKSDNCIYLYTNCQKILTYYHKELNFCSFSVFYRYKYYFTHTNNSKRQILMVCRSLKRFFIKCLVSMSATVPLLFLFSCGCKNCEDSGSIDGDTKIINGIECVYVSAGTFTMGSLTSEQNPYSNELKHNVTLTQGYWISKYEITQAQYIEVIGTNPSNSYGVGNNYPVYYVNWDDAVTFCSAVGGALPTEAQWEFAARGGNKSNGYIYSGSDNLDEVGWYWNNAGTYAYECKPVGTKSPNELGIYDMSGNLWEWVSDWYSDVYYNNGSVTNPAGPATGNFRVIRGGSWLHEAGACEVANRDNAYPSDKYRIFGFRVVFNAN